MPKYDLAGNPLPETGAPTTPASAPGLGGMPLPAAPPSYGAPPAYAPPGESAPVRRDLAGNVIPSAAPASPPATPYAPGPQSAPQPGVWPPPPSGNANTPYGMPQTRNNSGEKTGVPPEITALKWNWGAFWLTWLWCLNHGLVAWGVGILVGSIALGFIPGGGLVPLGVSIYFGIVGHKLGWQNRHFPGGVTQFFEVQRAWMKWAVGLFVVSLLIIPILAAILFPIFAKARMQARLRANGGYTQPYNLPTSNGGSGGQ